MSSRNPPAAGEPMLDIPNFGVAFDRQYHALSVWSFCQKMSVYCLPQLELVFIMMQLTGFGQRYASKLVRREIGEYWYRKGCNLQLRRYAQLRRRVYAVHGVAKKGTHRVAITALGEGIQVVRAICAFPVAAARKGEPTPRAYTARATGCSIRTVSRYRTIQRDRGYIRTTPQYLCLGTSPTAHTLAAGGAYRWGLCWYKRRPDLVEIAARMVRGSKLFGSDQSSPLKGDFTPDGGQRLVHELEQRSYKLERLIGFIKPPPPQSPYSHPRKEVADVDRRRYLSCADQLLTRDLETQEAIPELLTQMEAYKLAVFRRQCGQLRDAIYWARGVHHAAISDSWV